ncbi:hypothetical protein [Synechococcus sp. CC9311]|nr:hypothetical protein [Synechococcus sp. CC9311]
MSVIIADMAIDHFELCCASASLNRLTVSMVIQKFVESVTDSIDIPD